MKKHLIASTLAAPGLLAFAAWAQQSGISRADLLKEPLSVTDREVVQVRVGFAPGAFAPEHRHPGEEVAYVLEGTLEYRLEGGPPVTLRAGETLFIPAGAVHSARNVGGGRAAELATYIVEPGKPLVAKP